MSHNPATKDTPSFTLGPWHRNIPPAKKYAVIFAGRNTHVAVLSTQGLSDEEIEGNCNLIAAAPNLLAALKQCLAVVDAYRRISGGDGDISAMNARSAIAKAEGRS